MEEDRVADICMKDDSGMSSLDEDDDATEEVNIDTTGEKDTSRTFIQYLNEGVSVIENSNKIAYNSNTNNNDEYKVVLNEEKGQSNKTVTELADNPSAIVDDQIGSITFENDHAEYLHEVDVVINGSKLTDEEHDNTYEEIEEPDTETSVSDKCLTGFKNVYEVDTNIDREQVTSTAPTDIKIALFEERLFGKPKPKPEDLCLKEGDNMKRTDNDEGHNTDEKYKKYRNENVIEREDTLKFSNTNLQNIKYPFVSNLASIGTDGNPVRELKDHPLENVLKLSNGTNIAIIKNKLHEPNNGTKSVIEKEYILKHPAHKFNRSRSPTGSQSTNKSSGRQWELKDHPLKNLLKLREKQKKSKTKKTISLLQLLNCTSSKQLEKGRGRFVGEKGDRQRISNGKTKITYLKKVDNGEILKNQFSQYV